MRYFLLFAFSLILLSQSTRAADRVELPPEIQGFWAIPDCENNMAAFAYSGHFAMQASGGLHRINRLDRIEPAKNAGAYNVWSNMPGNPYIALKASGPDTLLYGIAIYVEGYADLEPMADETNPIAMHFKRCDTMPASITIRPDQMEVFRALDRIDNICNADGGLTVAECRKAIFDTADTDSNAALDAPELERFWQAVAFLTGAGSSCAAPAPSADPTASMMLTPAEPSPVPLPSDIEAKPFAAETLRMADRDSSGTLSLDEITTFMPVMIKENYGTRLHAAMPALATFMPWLVTPPPASPK
ncbi:MAG TPA: hypothetical protein VIG74_05080 [Alphaproteobacteria bacterium]|jgi:hypothetical protein